MKILAINASHRGRKGFTQVLIDKLFAGAEEAGAVCETVALAELKVNRCLACLACQREDNLLNCIYQEKDDVAVVFAKMREADLIVYATPIYIFNISGLLKTLLDRICSTCQLDVLRISKSGLFFHDIDSALCSKPFAALMSCDNMEDATPRSAVTYFKTYAQFMDAPLRGILLRRQGGLVGHGHDPEKESKFPKIRDVYQAYFEAGKILAEGKRIPSRVLRRANRNILPVPCLDLLRKIKPLKGKMLEKAKEMLT